MIYYVFMALPLVALMIQDWKTRTVNSLWLLLLFFLAAAGSIVTNGISAAISFFCINIVILLLVGVVLYAYSRVRRKSLNELGGLGDYLFFAALAPLYRPESYVRAAVVMLIFSLLLWLALKKRYKLTSIPLISFCGIPLIVMVSALVWRSING